MLGTKYQALVVQYYYFTTAVLNTKIEEAENRIPDTCGLVTTTILNTKIGEVEN